MEATELRLGNYIYGIEEGYKETALEICSLHSYKAFRLKIGNDSIGCYHCDLIEPILLTEEWLLKFGFIKITWSEENTYECDCFCITKMNDGYLLVENYFNNLSYINHVHQLQNLYFALTGNELTINR